MITYPIHHEDIAAKTASESGGSGHFSVLEWAGKRFQVVDGDGGMTLDETTNLRSAIDAAKRHARAYDRSEG